MRRLKEGWEFAEAEWSSSAVKSLFKKKQIYNNNYVFIFYNFLFVDLHS